MLEDCVNHANVLEIRKYKCLKLHQKMFQKRHMKTKPIVSKSSNTLADNPKTPLLLPLFLCSIPQIHFQQSAIFYPLVLVVGVVLLALVFFAAPTEDVDDHKRCINLNHCVCTATMSCEILPKKCISPNMNSHCLLAFPLEILLEIFVISIALFLTIFRALCVLPHTDHIIYNVLRWPQL